MSKSKAISPYPAECNLVIQKRKRTVTTSLVVAEKFGKQHKHVLEKIENLIEQDGFNRLIFRPVKYVDRKGESRKMYEMDRKSFSILVMSFTGKKAFEWKLKFYDAFEAMELALLRQQNESWRQARLEGKADRLEFTESVKNLVEFAEENGSKNAERYYKIFTNMIYKILFDISKIPEGFRDTLDAHSLKQIQLLEYQASRWIDDSVLKESDYHLPYKDTKAKVESMVEIIGAMNLSQQLSQEGDRYLTH